MKSIIYLVFSLLLFVNSSDAQTWYPANNPYGGNIIEILENDDGSFLCGTTSGLYKSTDQGEQWQSAGGEYQNFAVPGLASTPSGMYIASFGPFLQRSYDGGLTWESLTGGDWTSSGKMIVNNSGQIFINTNTSIWRSSNDGDTWTQLSIGGSFFSMAGLDISPDGELFAGTFTKKIFRSSDNGDSWTELFTADNDIRSFAFYGDDLVYACTSFSGLYKSEDNGNSWTSLSPIPGTDGALDLEVRASGALFAAVYDGGVFRSEDEGSSWEDITADLIHPDVGKVFVSSDDILFAGTPVAGVQRYQSGSWTAKNQGMTAIYIQRINAIDNNLYACTSAGVFISEDGGETWQQSIRGMDDPDILAIAKAPNGDLYAGGEMLYRSTDAVNWTNISASFPDSEVTCTDILAQPDGRIIISTEDYGINYSDDNGGSWTAANTGIYDIDLYFLRAGLDNYIFTSDGFELYRTNDLSAGWEVSSNGMDEEPDVEEFTAGDGVLFAVTYTDGLFRSTDNGLNWTLAIDEDFENIAVNMNEVYASGGGTGGGYVFLSIDNGINWSNIGSNLPDSRVDLVTYLQGTGLFAYSSDFGLYTLDFNLVNIPELSPPLNNLNCYPNPFSDHTNIQLQLGKASELAIIIYNYKGQIVEELPQMQLPAGIHTIDMGVDLDPGIYIALLRSGEQVNIVRMVKLEE